MFAEGPKPSLTVTGSSPLIPPEISYAFLPYTPKTSLSVRIELLQALT